MVNVTEEEIRAECKRLHHFCDYRLVRLILYFVKLALDREYENRRTSTI
jgi:hypothetical protein